MVAQSSRRLPGFRFEAQAPPLLESLPRMDVALFVGFAASGPVNVPVPVEDPIHFAAIFGGDVPVAWDRARGETVYAYLAPAVRAFFRNGGRRCWIVRVADDPQYNYFPVPGLLRLDRKSSQISPAFARSRSEGSWSDPLNVGATLSSRSVQVLSIKQIEQPGNKTKVEVELDPLSARSIVQGDLLRLTYRDEGYLLFLALRPQNEAGAPAVRFTGSSAAWLRMQAPDSPPATGNTPGDALIYTHDGASAPISASLIHDAGAVPGLPITLLLDLSSDNAPVPGSTISFSTGGSQLWVVVETSRLSPGTSSPPADKVEITGKGLWWESASPAPLPASSPEAEILSFEALVRAAGEYPQRMPDLGFSAEHPRYWGGLPTDFELFSDKERQSTSPYTGLVQEATASQRFPLAGNMAGGGAVKGDEEGEEDEEALLYFPLAMPAVAENFLAADASTLSGPERDGLARFGSHLFLDLDMVEAGTAALLGQADFLRWQSASPRHLRGIHAALSIEEATIIAVPDAVHRGWRSTGTGSLRDAGASAPLVRPEWWHSLYCASSPHIKAVPVSTLEKGQFHNSALHVIDPPTLDQATPDATGTFTVRWSWTAPSDEHGVSFVLEEAGLPDFSAAAVLYAGHEQQTTIYGRPRGDYYYRARAVVGPTSSDWSNGIAVRVAPAIGLELLDENSFSDLSMLAVQRGLLRMCAARGDMLALLILPEHYRDPLAVSHIARLQSPLAEGIEVVQHQSDRLPGSAPLFPSDESALSLPFDSGEAAVFSYAALYHPWLVGRASRAESDIRRTPPDGAACGVLAARSLSRGAWVAPANELLSGVVALTPTVRAYRWQAIQDAQINLIRHEPNGFLCLSADTLSDVPDLRPINVRRLLMLLRRLALREGSTFLFETNDDSFRRLVQRNLEALLADMFQRGAFAGGTAETAYQVVTGPSINTSQSIDQGRFVVELRVAPSVPLTFLTIRLVQAGDRMLVMEGR
jgi:hypothetical protein